MSRTTCICHWDGHLEGDRYIGGRKVAVVVDECSTYNLFCEDVCRCLSIDSRGKIFEYSPAVAREIILEMSNDANLKSMIACNNGLAMVYVRENSTCANVEANGSNGSQFSSTQLTIHRSFQSPLNSNLPAYPDKCATQPQLEEFTHEKSNVDEGDPFYIPEEDYDEDDFDIFEDSQARYMSEPQPCERIKVGVPFYDKFEFKQTLAEYSLQNKFNYKFKYNNQSYYRVECKFEGCPWALVAGAGKRGHMIVIHKITSDHQHTLQQTIDYKPDVMAKYLGNHYTQSMRESTDHWAPSHMMRAVASDFKINISYMKVWRSKEKAELMINGKPGEGYCFIPWMCSKIKESMPGTIAEFRVDDSNRFEQLYVSYGPNLQGFVQHCRPILFVDSCHRTEGYGGTIFSALGVDANNGLYPLAYSFASGENDNNWAWFFGKLKESLGEHKVVVVSDRNKSILKSVDQFFGNSYSAHCFRHLKNNFKSYMKGLRLSGDSIDLGLGYIDAIAYATRPEFYEAAMKRMEEFNQSCYEWVQENEPHHWAKTQFPHQRWGWMSTNPAESFNSWLGNQNLRQQNIFVFMKDHLLRMSTFQRKKFHDLRTWEDGISKRIKKKMDSNAQYALDNGYRSYPSVSNVKYTVRVWGYSYAVDLERHTCSCNNYQIDGFPCAHAMSAAKGSGIPVKDLVDSFYTKDVQEALLQHYIPPVCTHDEPKIDNVRDSAPTPPQLKRGTGRPKRKRIESQDLCKKTYTCSRCNTGGHRRSKCNVPLP